MFLKKIVIVGPTGIGKSEVAVLLAEKINAEIISADSMQIYKYMDIGTAKPSINELKKIHHHLIGHIHPQNHYNAYEYIQDANKAIIEIRKRLKNIIITGGTGMYLKAFLNGIIKDEKIDSGIREELENIVIDKGIEPLLEELKEVDPEKFKQLKHNDHRRIIRAVEFFRINKVAISTLQTNWNNSVLDDIILIGLNMDRSLLYKRIESRVDKMMSQGFLDEVQELKNMNLPSNISCMQAIGYKELFSYLNGELSLENAVSLVKRNSRRYAKRQLTWFRKVDNINWVEHENFKETVSKVIDLLKEREKILE